MTGTRERCLISFLVILVFGVLQLHFITSSSSFSSSSSSSSSPSHPCPRDVPGLRWVRDPGNCSVYFICVSSQPIRMPPCPKGNVWSVSGSNCVPVRSVWDDCPRGSSDSLDLDRDPDLGARPRDPSRPLTPSGLRGPQANHSGGDLRPRDPFRPSTSHSRGPPTPKSALSGEEQGMADDHQVSLTPVPDRDLRPRDPSRPSTSHSRGPLTHQSAALSAEERGTPGHSDDLKVSLTAEDRDVLRPAEAKRGLVPNHPCSLHPEERYVAHPGRCHWFFNCSAPLPHPPAMMRGDEDGWDPLTEECPYPHLFSTQSQTCQPYAKVDCSSRGLFLDPCEYRQLHCRAAHCQPCHLRHGSCVGMRDGLHPHPDREWTPRYLECQDQRAVQQLDCGQDKPIFSPETRRCESLQDIPKQHGGQQPSCAGRQDGRFPDETGRCDVFYLCGEGQVQGRFQCPPATAFHPQRQGCVRTTARGLPPPCGSNSTGAVRALDRRLSLCRGAEDGLYADPYGRCALYYECRNSSLRAFHRCQSGAFHPRSHTCQHSVADAAAPCGERPNPCRDQADGRYADRSSHCQGSVYCRRGVVVRETPCRSGTVFHEDQASCQLPDNTPPPCGLAPSCRAKVDGRYLASLKGCQFFYTCRAAVFRGYGRCSVQEGGFYFNSETGRCDFPQNVCAPCGVRSHNCTVSFDQL